LVVEVAMINFMEGWLSASC